MSWPGFIVVAVLTTAWAVVARGWFGLAVAGAWWGLLTLGRVYLDRSDHR